MQLTGTAFGLFRTLNAAVAGLASYEGGVPNESFHREEEHLMKQATLWLSALGFGFVTLTGAPNAAQAQVDEKQAAEIGVDAYVYGYSRTLSDMYVVEGLK